jgi:WD40 repeat protein
MAAQPQERYHSAAELAREVERWLADEPVSAYRDSVPARGARWARRHKPVVAAAAMLLLTAVIGLTAGILVVQAKQQQTEEARRQAEVNADKALVNEKKALANEKKAKVNERKALENEGKAKRNARQALKNEQLAKSSEREANKQKRRAEKEAREARKQKALALEQMLTARRHLYVAHLHLAHQSLERGEVPQVLHYLQRQRPQGDAQDLRSFEWYHLWLQCHSERFTLRGHPGAVDALAYSPDGKTLASACGTMNTPAGVNLWDCATGKLRARLSKQTGLLLLFSPDSKFLLTRGTDNALTIWNVDTGMEHTTLNAQGPAAFSPDGKALAAVAIGTVRLLESGSWKQRSTIRAPMTWIQALAFSPDNRLLAIGGGQRTTHEGTAFIKDIGEVKLWDLAKRKVLVSFKVPHGMVNRLVFSSDCKALAVVASTMLNPPVVQLRDPSTGKERATLQEHTGLNACVAFSQDSQILATGSGKAFSTKAQTEVYLWDAGTGKKLGTLQGHTRGILSLAFSPNEALLASGSEDGSVIMWDVGTRKKRQVLRGHLGPVQALAFAPSGGSIASGSEDKTVKVWPTRGNPKQALVYRQKGSLYSAVISPDGKTVAVGGDDHKVKFLKAAAGKELFVLDRHKYPVRALAFAPDGKTLASANGEGIFGQTYSIEDDPGEILLWDIAKRRKLLRLKGHQGWITAMSFSPQGKLLATASHDHTVHLWSPVYGTSKAVLRGHENQVTCVAFSPDGELLASGGGGPLPPIDPARIRVVSQMEPGEVRLWDPVQGKARGILKGHKAWVKCLAFSPDGKLLASASAGGTLKLWEVATRKERWHINKVSGSFVSLAFVPDKRALATGATNGAITFWDIQTGEERATLRKHGGPVNSLSFARDGKTLVSSAGSIPAQAPFVDPVGELIIWRAARDEDVAVESKEENKASKKGS